MPPTIHLIRHGQGFHNVDGGDYTLSDPLITTLGTQQALDLRTRSFSNQSRISLVVSSPMARAIQTAAIIFEPALTANGKCAEEILALPDLQETSDDACDTGLNPTTLEGAAIQHAWPVDLSQVGEGWNDKSMSSRYSPAADAIRIRARAARNYLKYRLHELVQQGDGDCQIAVVTHGSFLHFITEDWEDAVQNPGTGWQNCEMRSYVFEEQPSVDAVAVARLIETMESRRARGKNHPMFRGESQTQLYRSAMNSWGSQGLQRPDTVAEERLV